MFLRRRNFSTAHSLLQDESLCLILGVCILFALRICLARMTGGHLVTTGYGDDVLMMDYADLRGHFIKENRFPYDMLVKDMGFPLILCVIKFTGFVYTDVISLFWLFAALTSVALLRTLTERKNSPLEVAIVAFIMFAPIAFDEGTGTRIYRNAALTPLYFVVLNMLAIMFARPFMRTPTPVNFHIILGLVFTLTYYVKEDGIWLLICLAAVTTIVVGKIFFDGNGLRRVAIALIPLIIFAGGTVAYKTVNKIFLGVYLVNNRTEGELADFLRLIYKIKSDERSAVTWAPTDAIAKAFDASATLKAAPDLREAVMHTPWFGGDIKKNPIYGDFLGWVMLRAIYDSGTCKTLPDQEIFFGKVNAELRDAFDSGRLQPDDRFQLVSSAGGMTVPEIFSLVKLTLMEYFSHVTLLYLYEPGSYPQDFEVPAEAERAAAFTNMNLTEPNPHAQDAKSILVKTFALYSVVQSVMFATALVGTTGGVRKFFRRKKFFTVGERLMLAISFGALVLSAIYAFAIAWFCAFLCAMDQYFSLQFYSVGLVPMLMTFEIFGTYLFWQQKNRT